MSGKPYLSVTGLSIRFNGPEGWGHVLADLSFDVKQGELAAIIGPSGCGKSTLFNILAGLVKPDAGELCLDGRAVPNLKHRVAYMQQKDLLLPWRTVLDNAILGLEIKGMNKATARNQAMELMPVFGLAGSEQKRPAELSGGMRQRLALLRTMLCRKDVVLLDEPFGALDAITRRSMQDWFLDVWSRFRPTVLLVTHDVEEALVMADRIYVMNGQPAGMKNFIRVNSERPRSVVDPEIIAMKAKIIQDLEMEP
jgi:ABC-type nitrate/sulfonate/bicarbonate transport system ATPase subunit